MRYRVLKQGGTKLSLQNPEANFRRSNGRDLKHKFVILVTALIVSVVLCSCAGYTKPFEGIDTQRSKMREKKEFIKNAQKTVYPSQVREFPERYANQFIAWAGIVQESRPVNTPNGPAIEVVIVHRYFDWIERHGVFRELFFLSPRGEDAFKIYKKTDALLTLDSALQEIPISSMVGAVGRIDLRDIKDKSTPISLMTQYLLIVREGYFRSDVFDYGRDGEPVVKIRNSKFWKKFGTDTRSRSDGEIPALVFGVEVAVREPFSLNALNEPFSPLLEFYEQ